MVELPPRDLISGALRISLDAAPGCSPPYGVARGSQEARRIHGLLNAEKPEDFLRAGRKAFGESVAPGGAGDHCNGMAPLSQKPRRFEMPLAA